MTSTDRIYRNLQADFLQWCRASSLRVPPAHKHVATYLAECLRTRGASTVLVRCSAIARLYREHDDFLDVKSPGIQKVLKEAREKSSRQYQVRHT